MAKQKKPKVNESKVELAKTIAEKSEKIVRSYANIENTFAKAFRWLSSWFDRLLFNQRYSKEVALILAIIIYIATNSADEFSIAKPMQNMVKFENQAVISEVNSSVYEVTGLPDTVTLYLYGSMADLQMIETQKTQRVTADLSGLGEGTHKVNLTVPNLTSRIEASVDPSTAYVTITKKTTQTFSIGYDFINTKNMQDIYALSVPEFERTDVNVRASQETINNISVVKALIDVSNVSSDFTYEAPLVAYDQKGDRMKVDIVPDKVKASVKVTSPSKDVPISIIPIGEIPNNKAISKYSLDNQALTIFGPQEILDTINGIDIQVPVKDFNSSPQTLTMPINLPSGVRKKTVSAVNITIELADKEVKKIDDILIQYKNNTSNYQLTIDEEEPRSISVNVAGAAEVLENEHGNGIVVYIDLADVTQTGTIELPLYVTGTNKLLQYSLDKQTIKVNIKEASN